MYVVHDVVEVSRHKCIGCMKCDRVCPTGAIVTRGELARVDVDICTGCRRCIEACHDTEAISLLPLDEPRAIHIETRPEEAEEVERLCTRARLEVHHVACPCTATTAGQIATAIVRGAQTPEDVATMSGARALCSLWCAAPTNRLLEAAGVPVDRNTTRDWRVYQDHAGLEVGLWNISDEVAEKYPEYRLKENRDRLETENVKITGFGSITRTPSDE